LRALYVVLPRPGVAALQVLAGRCLHAGPRVLHL
jgi:hypothetical protein